MIKLSPKDMNLSPNLQKKYSGMYVLTDKPGGKVVAASRKLNKAFQEAEEKGYQNPAVQFVPPYGVIVNYAVKTFEIPCVFNPNEEVPILLGRAGIIDKFNILLDGKKKEIVFEEI